MLATDRFEALLSIYRYLFMKREVDLDGDEKAAPYQLHLSSQINGSSGSSRTRRQQQGGTDFGFTPGRHYGYDEIVGFMRRVEGALGSTRARIRSIGQSVEGRQIQGIEV